MNTVLMSPIATVVAALIGSFLGTYLKERFSEFFFRRKRKLEIRTSLSRELTLFLNNIIEVVNIINTIAPVMRQIKIMRATPKEHPDAKSIIRSQQNLTEFYNGEVHRSYGFRNKVSEHEANINALIHEAILYNRRKKDSLLEILKTLRTEKSNNRMEIEIYNGDNLVELAEFRNTILPPRINQLMKSKEIVIQQLNTQIDEILKP